MAEVKRKPGRPRREIDWELVSRLAEIQCTGMEISAVLNIPNSTLTSRPEFAEIYKKGLEIGKTSIRRAQFALMEKNPAMAIWLGKQHLGQRDDKHESFGIETVDFEFTEIHEDKS